MGRPMGTITPENTAAILLAAGESRRFGDDKLLARLGSRPILDFSAAALAQSHASTLIAIVPAASAERRRISEAYGFSPVLSEGGPMSDSLRLGVKAAQAAGAYAALIALADMPFIPAEHYSALFAAVGDTGIAFTAAEVTRAPPAIFDRRWFSHLLGLTGDAGARSVLAYAPASSGVAAKPYWLLDIDTPDDASRAARDLQLRRGFFSAC